MKFATKVPSLIFKIYSNKNNLNNKNIANNSIDKQKWINKLTLNIFFNSSTSAFFPKATDKKRWVETKRAPLTNDNIAITPATKLYKPKSSTPSNFNATLVDINVTIAEMIILAYKKIVFVNIDRPCFVIKNYTELKARVDRKY